ncbi:hypothetical protein DQ384_38025 [Sphaerisporangium album]|uniref:DUF7694 domain-containing protein n=1 Tax=Sphaerisporangium album TaxID=509200 RepID=A0A367EM15_9ACTN|nr:hypothetical protein [Sphaerisporangium album]RCG19081.1 hypothetical protein DQ384_38025 [Sphaerisporangium album]
MTDLHHLALLDVDPTHLYRTLRRAGLRPWPPEPYGPAGIIVTFRDRAGSVVVTQCELDGAQWIHASISWTDHMPSYEDLATLKAGVFGDQREAYQVFPRAARHVNIHGFALHLWGRADGAQVLPDLGAMGTI